MCLEFFNRFFFRSLRSFEKEACEKCYPHPCPGAKGSHALESAHQKTLISLTHFHSNEHQYVNRGIHFLSSLQVQDKLFGQMSQLSGKTVTSADYDACSYAKAVIKESFRMAPISVGVGRTLGKHAVLNGYHVPAGTFTVTQNQVSCRLPEYFSEPDTFVPERWFREDQTVEKKSTDTRRIIHGFGSINYRTFSDYHAQSPTYPYWSKINPE
uniref:Cytochrome P450 302a1, mitochondrial n=1 Tax=Cacopsylla melanoneura TaxID=428564 RepID=A0A8D8Z6N7_9HEMI